MNEPKPLQDQYHGVGGRYVINAKGERVPAPGPDQALAKAASGSKPKEKKS